MTPQYELRMIVESTSVWRLEIWQLRSPATPRLKAPEHVATLHGSGLRMVENRLLKRRDMLRRLQARCCRGTKLPNLQSPNTGRLDDHAKFVLRCHLSLPCDRFYERFSTAVLGQAFGEALCALVFQ